MRFIRGILWASQRTHWFHSNLDNLDRLNILQVIKKNPVELYILYSNSERGFIGEYSVLNLKKSVISNYIFIHVQVKSIYAKEGVSFINNTNRPL